MSAEEQWEDYLDQCRMIDEGGGCYDPSPEPPSTAEESSTHQSIATSPAKTKTQAA